MTARHKQELRYLGLGWCIACSVAALVGGVVGMLTWINDDSLEYL